MLVGRGALRGAAWRGVASRRRSSPTNKELRLSIMHELAWPGGARCGRRIPRGLTGRGRVVWGGTGETDWPS